MSGVPLDTLLTDAAMAATPAIQEMGTLLPLPSGPELEAYADLRACALDVGRCQRALGAATVRMREAMQSWTDTIGTR